jgi:hypothetical protein
MNCLHTWATPRVGHAEIAHEVELCECQFVTIIIDIVHDATICVRRKGLIGSTEDFRFTIADFGLSYRFSMSARELGYNEWNPSSLTRASAREGSGTKSSKHF